jgi:hypothetical protein
MQIQTLKALASAARSLARAPRNELAVLEAWWQSPLDEQAARGVESRLFFEPALLQAARQQQRSRPRRAARVFASLVFLALACGTLPGVAHAEEASAAESETSAPSSGFSLWDWMVAVLTGGSAGDMGEDPGNGVDP